jgi:hypothetical protein
MGSDSHFCGPEPCVPLSASIVRDMNRRWVIDAHSKHWIALNSCTQSKLWIKHPKLQTTKYLLSLPKKQLRIPVSLITGHCCLNKHLDRMGLATCPSCLCILQIGRGDGTSLCVCLSVLFLSYLFSLLYSFQFSPRGAQ